MTLDEAIEIKLRERQYRSSPLLPSKVEEADLLSIEALKAVKEYQETASHKDLIVLPSQTKD